MDNFALQQIIDRIPLLKFRYLGSFPSDHVPTPDNDTFAIINTQPSNMQGEHLTAFHLFKFQQEEITGVNDANVLSFINNFM